MAVKKATKTTKTATVKKAAPKKANTFFEGEYKESYMGLVFIYIFMFVMNVLLDVPAYNEVFFPIAVAGIMGELIYNYNKTKAPMALLGATACALYIIYVVSLALGLVVGA